MSININRISGRALKFFATIAVIVSFTILYKEDTYAASFNHVHTDECYQTVTKTCSDHRIFVSTHTHVYHCFTCQVMRDFTETIYWDICNAGLQNSIDGAYRQVCTVCGSTRRYEDPISAKSHKYTAKELVCGKDESTPVANVGISAASSAPTNGSVILTIDVTGLGPDFALASEPYNFGAGNTSNPSFEVTENGTYNATVTDSKGRTVSVSFNVDSIDRSTPVIDAVSKSTEAWSESGVVISVDAHDEGLGLAAEPYSFNGGAFGSDNSFKVTSNGTVSVRVKDAAGNITEKSVTIANVGRDPKVVEAERREAERVAAEKAAAEKAAADKAAAEKAAADKAAQEKEAAEKAARDKAAKEKASKASKDTSKTTVNDIAKTASKNNRKSESSEDIKNIFGQFKDTVTGGSAIGNAYGKLIAVKDLTAPEEEIVIDDSGEDVIESVNDFSNETYETAEETFDAKNGTGILKASAGDVTVPAGILLLLAGAFFISRFSYVYVMQGGKKRLICRCRVIKGQNGLTAVVPEGKLTAHGKYLLYISPWKKGFNKKLPVSVMLEGEDAKIPTDEGIAFKY